MIRTEFVEDAYNYAPDLVAATSGKGNRLYQCLKCLFVVTCVERRESPAEIRHPASFEPDPGR